MRWDNVRVLPLLAHHRHSIHGSFYYDYLSSKITKLFLSILINYGTLRLFTHFTQKVCNERPLTTKIDGFHFVSLDFSFSFLSLPLPLLSLSLPRSSPLSLCFPSSVVPPPSSTPKSVSSSGHSGFICILSSTLLRQWANDAHPNHLPWKGLFQAANISWPRTHDNSRQSKS